MSTQKDENNENLFNSSGLSWDDVVHLRLPISRERLYGNYRSALAIILMILSLYSIIRAGALFSFRGYDAYEEEFDLIVGGRTSLAIYWSIAFILLWIGLHSKKYFLWRLALIYVGVGLSSWALMFYINRGIRVFDTIHTYSVFAVLCFTLAIFSNDPRPIRQIREKLEEAAF